MTEEKEVEQSSDAITDSMNTNPMANNIEIDGEKITEDKKEIEEKEEGIEEDGEEKEDDFEREEEEEEEENGEGEETETEEDTEDEEENKLEPGPIDGEKVLDLEVSLQNNIGGTRDSPLNGVRTSKSIHVDEVIGSPNDGEALVENNVGPHEKPDGDDELGSVRPDNEKGNNVNSNAYDFVNERTNGDETMSENRSSFNEEHMKEEPKNETKIKEGTVLIDGRNPSEYMRFDSDISGGGESGTEEEQAEFMREIEKFHKERSLDFRPPKFYGGPLNLLKLWRAVVKLGGYDKVTACKYWRQVGESFNPPKTCTTVSWTFRVFYEKALLDYERYRASIDSSSVPGSFIVAGGAENPASGSGRARRESAARAMQGWHSQRILDNGEVSDPIIKDKNSVSANKKEKQLKNLGISKRKKTSSTDLAINPAQMKFPKTQAETTVIDIGLPADWVKINVRVTKDCYEVYALVPGLLREEVRVQSDPAGRLVISGEPENPDNPWSVTPFKKVVSLPSRIDPHQTSAVVTLHGQLFVRVPFEQYD